MPTVDISEKKGKIRPWIRATSKSYMHALKPEKQESVFISHFYSFFILYPDNFLFLSFIRTEKVYLF